MDWERVWKMARIDDPLEQIEERHRDAEDGAGLTVALNVVAAITALLDPVTGAAVTVTGFVKSFLGQTKINARAEAFRNGLRDSMESLDGRLERIESTAVGPDAEEAFVIAVRHALGSARLDKARRFGQVFGGTLAAEAPDWEEAAEFIRNLEEFNDADFEALKILWKVQHGGGFRVMDPTSGHKEMSTDANDYTKTWTGVLDHATKAGVSKDDWYSRCGRLSGFGLVLPVKPNDSYQSPEDTCHRLTSRAVRLLGLLGRKVDSAEYPKTLYHATKELVEVHDEDAERALGDGWAESPDAFK